MKFVKLSIFALTMGLFIASCGNSESEAPAEDTAAMAAPAAPAADTTMAAPAADTTAAPAVDTTAKH
jgi:hypothetical protein